MEFQETLNIRLGLRGEYPNYKSEVDIEIMDCQTGETKTQEFVYDGDDVYHHLKYNLCRYVKTTVKK